MNKNTKLVILIGALITLILTFLLLISPEVIKWSFIVCGIMGFILVITSCSPESTAESSKRYNDFFSRLGLADKEKYQKKGEKFLIYKQNVSLLRIIAFFLGLTMFIISISMAI